MLFGLQAGVSGSLQVVSNGDRGASDIVPVLDLPTNVIADDCLSRAIKVAADAASFRAGYDVELAVLEPIERQGHSFFRVHWRRKVESLQAAGDGENDNTVCARTGAHLPVERQISAGATSVF
jgi:hypothetical protein